MVYLENFWFWITTPYRKYKERKEQKRILKEMQEKDPFIYK